MHNAATFVSGLDKEYLHGANCSVGQKLTADISNANQLLVLEMWHISSIATDCE